ncbi:hypothetical protein F511_33602 [Dorcoceras hygrometricum]|uniref:Uncharacterized protein n=1 Tax=Dorcoceras hygrometricum TaxID=472368 RepID=A0A2Z7DC86_9LAMI|nr:hypothetical protein F511_33602 [Dorcoceras hygrometricum]
MAITAGAPQWIEKTKMEYTEEDKKKDNLDNVAKDILYKTLDNDMFSKIKTCATAKRSGKISRKSVKATMRQADGCPTEL